MSSVIQLVPTASFTKCSIYFKVKLKKKKIASPGSFLDTGSSLTRAGHSWVAAVTQDRLRQLLLAGHLSSCLLSLSPGWQQWLGLLWLLP